MHRAAMVGQYIHDSKAVNDPFDARYINLTTVMGMGDIGRYSLKKVRHFQR